MRFDAVAMIFANVASGFPGGKHHVMPCHHSLAEALRNSALAPPASQRIQRESAGRIGEGR